MYILTSLYRQDDPLPVRRLVLGRLGSCIERLREAGGRSREQSVHLARMEVHEWITVEAGALDLQRSGGRSPQLIYSPPEEGGESDREERSIGTQKSEYQR